MSRKCSAESIQPKGVSRKCSAESVEQKMFSRKFSAESVQPKVFSRNFSAKSVQPKLFSRMWSAETAQPKGFSPAPSLFWHFRNLRGALMPKIAKKPSQFKGEISKNRKTLRIQTLFKKFRIYGVHGAGCTQRRPWFSRKYSV